MKGNNVIHNAKLDEHLALDSQRWNYLLIDGVALPEAEKQLYQACECPDYINLFAGSVYGDIADVGPLLVRITPTHPLAKRLINEDFSLEWGYLLCSNEGLPALADWFRRFIIVGHPTGVNLFLRFAEPAVGSVLWGEAGLFRRVGTPVHEVLLPDALESNWKYIEVPACPGQVPVEPIMLTDRDLDALMQVDERNLLRGMIAHLDEYFPEWAEGAERRARRATLQQLLDFARQANYSSERALTQWTNVFGFLRPDRVPLDLEEPIKVLLEAVPPGTDADSAAREAAVLARQSKRVAINENSRTEKIA